jgi:carbamoyl-phosphate synthase small subunit
MERRNQALLCTADGEVFRGVSVGADGVATGEAVFNTSMSGYQEILTDPSYSGQVVVMTTSHIGNYGVNSDDDQSGRPYLSGFVMRAIARRDSNWRSEGTVASFLRSKEVVAIAEIDTRRLTRHLRDKGAMPVAMGAGVDESELLQLASSAPTMGGQDLASQVSTSRPYVVEPTADRVGHVVAYDLGIKRDILSNLTSRGFSVEVVPSGTPASVVMKSHPDGVFISNGPGDPEPLESTIDALRGLLGRVPVFGICLGHQVLGLAAGATTFKLPFGHHGGNHPVRRMEDGRVQITSQNHGFAVDLWSLSDGHIPEREGLVEGSLLPARVESRFGAIRPTHQNLNDGTLEGLEFEEIPAFSVQYHPEAAPGPRESTALFDDFVALMGEGS